MYEGVEFVEEGGGEEEESRRGVGRRLGGKIRRLREMRRELAVICSVECEGCRDTNEWMSRKDMGRQLTKIRIRGSPSDEPVPTHLDDIDAVSDEVLIVFHMRLRSERQEEANVGFEVSQAEMSEVRGKQG